MARRQAAANVSVRVEHISLATLASMSGQGRPAQLSRTWSAGRRGPHDASMSTAATILYSLRQQPDTARLWRARADRLGCPSNREPLTGFDGRAEASSVGVCANNRRNEVTSGGGSAVNKRHRLE